MISFIVAKGKNNVIGKDNDLLWKISADLKRFKQLTMGHTIIMGRKTFESMPGVLPGRPHVIITRNKDYKVQDENVMVVNDLNDLKPYVDEGEENFVIGGEKIFKALLPQATKLYITEIKGEEQGDVYFPEINEAEWTVEEQSEELFDERNNINFYYKNLKRL